MGSYMGFYTFIKLYFIVAKISNPQSTYERFSDASIIGANFDYYCLESRSLSSCEIAVSSIEEAKVTCSMSEECKAFVVTQRSNWLGKCRLIAYS